jgi:hypothetical protein
MKKVLYLSQGHPGEPQQQQLCRLCHPPSWKHCQGSAEGRHGQVCRLECYQVQSKSRIGKYKKNIPSHKHRLSDISGNVVKCKQFLPVLIIGGRMPGLVEFVASSFRFCVFIAKVAVLYPVERSFLMILMVT